jgi:hypothetical protein
MRSASRVRVLEACGAGLLGGRTETQYVNDFCEAFAAAPFDVSAGAFLTDGYRPTWNPDDETTRLSMPGTLNALAGAFTSVKASAPSVASPPSTAAYLEGVMCAQTVFDEMLAVPDGVPTYSGVETSPLPQKTVTPYTAMYRFSQYGLYEYPFSWFVQCSLLAGRHPTDGSVACGEWDGRFHPSDAVSNAAPREDALATWDFLTRIRGGVLLRNQTAEQEEWAERWRDTVEEVGTMAMFRKYFATNGGTNEMERECVTQRNLVRDYIDDSNGYRDHVQDTVSGGSGTFYRRIERSFVADESGRTICTGEAGCQFAGTGPFCGCTDAAEVRAEFTDVFGIPAQYDTPTRLAVRYMRSGDTSSIVQSHDFLGTSPLPSLRPTDMHLAMQRIVRLDVDDFGKLRFTPAEVQLLIALSRAAYPGFNFPERSVLECAMVDIESAEFSNYRRCFGSNRDNDPRIKNAEDAFPGGSEGLEASRQRLPYVMAVMGDNAHDHDWLAPGQAAGAMYDRTAALKNGFMNDKGTYEHSSGIRVGVAPAPDLGVAGYSLHTASRVDLGLYGARFSASTRFGVDSFCGFLNGGQRSDTCGPNIGPHLDGCPQEKPTQGPKAYSRFDPMNRQTCVHDHSCTLTLMSQDDRNNFGAISVGTEFSNIPPAAGRLYGMDLWRWHGLPDSKTRFHMPIGTFLEVFSMKNYDVGLKDNPLYNAGFPAREHGMWTMCPHLGTTVSPTDTRTTAAAKSRLMLDVEPPTGLFEESDWQHRDAVDHETPTFCAASEGGIGTCDVSNGWRSYRVGLLEGYTMEPDQCGALNFPMPVQQHIYKCVGCSWWQPTYCRGKHECLFPVTLTANQEREWAINARFIPDSVRNTAREGDVRIFQSWDPNAGRNLFRSGMSDQAAVEAALHVLGNALLEHNGGSNLLYAPVPSMPLYDYEDARWNPSNVFEGYAAGVNAKYENEELPPLPSGSGSRCAGVTELALNYDGCDFSDNYQAAIDSFEHNMRFTEGIVVRAGIRAAYFTDKEHMMADGIPSWSRADRNPEQTFARTILNSTLQCTYASKAESVCSVNPNSGTPEFYVMNPWLGGAFNVFERSADGTEGGCDTNLLETLRASGIDAGYSVTEPIVVDPTCSYVPVCSAAQDGARLRDSQPDVCTSRAGNLQSTSTVPKFSQHNLCTKRPPPNPPLCTHEQGMIDGLSGAPVGDLHVSKEHGIMGERPGGLFSNPLFAGRSVPGASYGRLYSEPGEIAGHHIVYAIDRDTRKLRVRAVPLQHYTPGNKLSVFETSDFVDTAQPGVLLTEWLPNLPVDIALDGPRNAHMRFNPERAANAHWTCPLRQMLLWSGQDPDFLPYVPNPERAHRLYGDILTPYSDITGGTPGHPTSRTMPIDHAARLHTDYWTTNGFCVYRGDATPASVVRTGKYEECSLYSLARSVFSGEYHNYTTVFATACAEQVLLLATPRCPHGVPNRRAHVALQPLRELLGSLPSDALALRALPLPLGDAHLVGALPLALAVPPLAGALPPNLSRPVLAHLVGGDLAPAEAVPPRAPFPFFVLHLYRRRLLGLAKLPVLFQALSHVLVYLPVVLRADAHELAAGLGAGLDDQHVLFSLCVCGFWKR